MKLKPLSTLAAGMSAMGWNSATSFLHSSFFWLASNFLCSAAFSNLAFLAACTKHRMLRISTCKAEQKFVSRRSEKDRGILGEVFAAGIAHD